MGADAAVDGKQSDSEIERNVKEELRWDPDLDVSDIAVSVKNVSLRWQDSSRATPTNTRPKPLPSNGLSSGSWSDG
jgi:hypothetical protein